MAQGTQRREGAQDNLAGQTVEVTSRSAAPLRVPQVNTPDLSNSASAKIARGLSEFSSQQFQNAANLQHEADALDGQMAHMQGQAMEDVEMEGNKWKLSGYRVMEAQSISSTMLAAQQEMIRQLDYEKDPDAFRAQFVSRMEAQIDGLDPQTAAMVREQMASQLPALVGQHTQAHLKYQEEEAFNTLVTSVDIMGKDETALDAFISNVDGTGGSGGLSQARRTQAVTEGVVRAFQGGNPLAFARIKKMGKLSEFTSSQIAAMESAERSHQAKLRETYDAAYIEEQQGLIEDLESGRMEAPEAMAAMSELMSRYGMDITMAEGRAVYLEADQTRQMYLTGNKVLYENAMAMGDWRAMADLSFDTVIWHESKGREDAVGPEIKSGANKGDRAMGAAQVMPLTATDPGYGIKPADINDPADVKRVGKEYWTALISGSEHSSGHFPWPPGDVEAAAIAYNAGPKNAAKWFRAGRDYSVLPDRAQTEPYAKAIAKEVSGGGRRVSAKERLATAEQTAKQIEQELGVYDYLAHMEDQRESFAKLKAGELTTDEYMAEALHKLKTIEDMFTTQNVQTIYENINQFNKDTAKAVAKQTDADKDDRLHLFEAQAEANRKDYEARAQAIINATDALGVPQEIDTNALKALSDEYWAKAQKNAQQAGFTASEADLGGTYNAMRDQLRLAMERQVRNEIKGNLADDAMKKGYVDAVDPEIQEIVAQKDEVEIREVVKEAVDSGVVDEADKVTQRLVEHQARVERWDANQHVPEERVREYLDILRQEPLVGDDQTNARMVDVMNLAQQAFAQGGDKLLSQMVGDDAGAMMQMKAIMRLSEGDMNEAVARYGRSSRFVKVPSSGEVPPEFIQKTAEYVSSELLDKELVGRFQSWWHDDTVIGGRAVNVTASERERRQAELPKLNDAIADEMLFLKSQFPQYTADEVAAEATRRVAGRTEFVGGQMLIARDSKSTMKQFFFGDGKNHDLLQAPGTLQDMFLSYVQDQQAAGAEGFAALGELTGKERSLLNDILFDTVIEGRDAEFLQSRGVRNFDVAQIIDPQTKALTGVAIYVEMPDGTATHVNIPQSYGLEYRMKLEQQFNK